MEHNKYTTEQMEQILKNAIKKQGTKGNISHDDLLATAKELGIDELDLQSAIEDYLEGISPLEEAKLEWRKQKKRKFYEHLRTYLIMNAMFTGICYYSGDDWFIWPLMGWGVGLAFDAFSSLMPNDTDVERGAKKILKRRNLTSAFDTIKSVGNVKGKAGGKDFKIDITTGKIIIEHGDKRIEFGGK
ncbi:MAG: 2TM domain-containing protein [Ignavibacteria bacterium]|nr:2TM domain-containing protein [Ignavibacteria bacterium]